MAQEICSQQMTLLLKPIRRKINITRKNKLHHFNIEENCQIYMLNSRAYTIKYIDKEPQSALSLYNTNVCHKF